MVGKSNLCNLILRLVLRASLIFHFQKASETRRGGCLNTSKHLGDLEKSSFHSSSIKKKSLGLWGTIAYVYNCVYIHWCSNHQWTMNRINCRKGQTNFLRWASSWTSPWPCPHDLDTLSGHRFCPWLAHIQKDGRPPVIKGIQHQSHLTTLTTSIAQHKPKTQETNLFAPAILASTKILPTKIPSEKLVSHFVAAKMPRCPEMYMYTFVRFFVIFSTSTWFFLVENVNWSTIFVCWSCDVSLIKMVYINQRSWGLISKTWKMFEKS